MLNHNEIDVSAMALAGLARRYIYLTEAYDRAICHTRHEKTGDALPVTPEERQSCTSYAKRKLEELTEVSRVWGFAPGDLLEKIQNLAGQVRFEDLKQEFELSDKFTGSRSGLKPNRPGATIPV